MTIGLLSFVSPTVAVGSLKSLTIADATPIDPVSSVGASGSGWVAIVTLKGLTSLVGTAVPSDLTVNVTDPGYDASGNVTTVSRTLKGVAHLRRQYPNGNSKIISTDGTDLTLYVTLDDWVYSGTTIVSATIGTTFYPSCSSSNATTKLNLSTTAYTKPLFGWINPQQESSGATFDTESVAFHRHATAGRQVACIKYSANDGTTTSPVVTVAATALSSKITKGQVPEVWKATLDMSTLAQATMATVNAQVYPWIGDSSAILDLSVDGYAWPTALPITKLRVFNDRTGGYGGAFAYVQNSASGGTVSTTAATARAAPFPTIEAALNAIQTFNNANKSHNDFGGGTVRLMDTAGANTTISINGHPNNAPGQCWCNIEKDPLSSSVLTVTTASQQQFPQLLRWRNLTAVPSAALMFLGYDEARSLFCADNCVFDSTSGVQQVTWYAMKYYYNITLIGAVTLNNLPSATANIPICAGLICANSTSSPADVSQAKMVIGCKWDGSPSTANGITAETNATGDGDHGRIIYNSRFYTTTFINASAKTINFGIANVQNQYETDSTSGNAIASNWFADSDLTTITNYIEQHTTIIGNRGSRLYNDTSGAKTAPNGVIKLGSSKFCLTDQLNVKSDTFSAGSGSVGNWAYSYSVGNIGNVSLFGDVSASASSLPHNDNTDVPYLGNAWLPSSEPNLFQTANGFTSAQIMAMFTSYTAVPQASPARGGNYVPINTASRLKGRVPSGQSVLTYDLLGATRKADGTGAAGAFEAAP